MSLAELLPAVRGLGRGDKMRLIQLFADDLVRQEGSFGPGEGAEYPIWSPFGCADGGEALQRLLDRENAP